MAKGTLRRFRKETRYVHQRSEGLRWNRSYDKIMLRYVTSPKPNGPNPQHDDECCPLHDDKEEHDE